MPAPLTRTECITADNTLREHFSYGYSTAGSPFNLLMVGPQRTYDAGSTSPTVG